MHRECSHQGQKDFAIILAKIRDTAIFNRLYIKLYIKFVANNGNKNCARCFVVADARFPFTTSSDQLTS